MPRYVEISLRAEIPEGEDDLGHDAIVKSRPGVAAIVETLSGLGLTVGKPVARIIMAKPRSAAPPAAPLAVAAE